jgi:hypothetical protein
MIVTIVPASHAGQGHSLRVEAHETTSIRALKLLLTHTQALPSDARTFLPPQRTHPNIVFVYMQRILSDDLTLLDIAYSERHVITLVHVAPSPTDFLSPQPRHSPPPCPTPTPPPMPSGQRVTLHGLVNSAWLNGCDGEVG